MLGEKAERRSVAPISSAAEWKRFLKISRRVGSTRTGSPPSGWGQENLAVGIDARSPSRRYKRRGAVFSDHRGARKPVPCVKPIALDPFRPSHTPRKQASSLTAPTWPLRLRRTRDPWQGWLLGPPRRATAHVDHLDRACSIGVTVSALVRCVKRCHEVAGGGDAQFVSLSDVAQIQPAF